MPPVPTFAANPAAFPQLLLRMVEQANPSPSTGNNGGGLHSPYRVSGRSKKAAIRVDASSQGAVGNFAPVGVSRNISRLMLGHCFGPVRRPAARRSSASAFAALRVTVSTCGGASVNAELGTWEPGPLAWLRPV